MFSDTCVREKRLLWVFIHSFIHSSQCQNICDVYDDGSFDISSVRDVIVINYDKYTTHILTF